jgi:AhpD family alkylhydroperoxidase
MDRFIKLKISLKKRALFHGTARAIKFMQRITGITFRRVTMSKKYHDVTSGISTQLAKMRKEMPEVMAGFSSLAAAATKDGVLDKKTKELIAMALAVANHCPGCIGFHSQTLVKLQTSREELIETLGMAVYMGGGPSLMYAAEALEAFEEFNQ